MKRKLLTALVVVALSALAGTVAFAAHATLGTTRLGAGSTVVAPCDPHASSDWTYTFSTPNSAGQVTGLTIGGIATSCEGGALTVETTDSDGGNLSSSGAVTIPSGGGSCTSTCSQPVTLGTPEDPAHIADVESVVDGP